MTKLQISDGRRAHLEGNHGLTTDNDGNETMRGLTVAESIEYIDLTTGERARDSKSRNRRMELHQKHEFARKSVILAVVDARNAGEKH